MKIAVIGVGFVGSAVAEFIENHAHQLVEVFKVDPKWYPTTVFDVGETCDAFILCLPTPEDKDGKCDDSIIKTVIKYNFFINFLKIFR